MVEVVLPVGASGGNHELKGLVANQPSNACNLGLRYLGLPWPLYRARLPLIMDEVRRPEKKSQYNRISRLTNCVIITNHVLLSIFMSLSLFMHDVV